MEFGLEDAHCLEVVALLAGLHALGGQDAGHDVLPHKF